MMQGTRRFLMATIGVVVLGGAIFLGQGMAQGTGSLDPAAVKTPEMTPALNLGKLNYDAYCAKCHGANTAGTDKGPTFLNRVYHPGHHGDDSFFTATKKGARAHHWPFGDMKPVKGVTDAQIKSIVPYVRAVQKANGLF